MDLGIGALGCDPPSPAELAAQAWARAARAIRRGRLSEPQGWTRLWRELLSAVDGVKRARAAQVSAEQGAATQKVREIAGHPIAKPQPTRDAADTRSAQSRKSVDEVHLVHSVHPVSSALDGVAVGTSSPARTGEPRARDGPPPP